jgi:hypothetical protein
MLEEAHSDEQRQDQRDFYQSAEVGLGSRGGRSSRRRELK